MNTRATGASTRQRGLSAHAAQRNSATATRTAAHACASVSRPAGSSRARVRGFFASWSRPAMRLNPSATKRAQVNASTTSASVRHVMGRCRDATNRPSSANGNANTVCGSFTKFTYRTSRLSPASVCPSRSTAPPPSTPPPPPPPPSELKPQLPPHRIHLLSPGLVHPHLVRPPPPEPPLLPFPAGACSPLP